MHTTPFGPFQSCSPDEMRAMLRAAPFPWWIAGGWAIELFVGRPTREHEDMDIEVFRRDLVSIRRMFATWDMQAPHPSVQSSSWPFLAWPADSPPPDGMSNLWCRPAPAAPWVFDLQIADTAGDEWLFRRNHAITHPLHSLVLHTADGIPYLTPEVQLLYKAKNLRPKDADDFSRALPLLSPTQRHWLRAALARVSPEHQWLAELKP